MEEVFRLLGGALRLDPAMFARVDDQPLTYIWPALGVALMAAASTMLGRWPCCCSTASVAGGSRRVC
ncbi:hypothetical protein G7085_20010 [Tessaracoccus sp. HDW20]|uniref:hypothetical protein n=1 Tax=Tessaracoccus coleopterorum TaxID=2714950 RepID=UPI0018D457BA|nr:hypothetical protein [Tessaracoccus coleopterorum]NHB86043.1 hypothetical protein [Tessaracoccus coleopterorum]